MYPQSESITGENSLTFITQATSFQEALNQGFSLVPLSIKTMDMIRVHSTIQVVKTLGDYLSKVVFAHRPLPPLSEDEIKKIISITRQIHAELLIRFPVEYQEYLTLLNTRNTAAFWFNHSNSYWNNL